MKKIYNIIFVFCILFWCLSINSSKIMAAESSKFYINSQVKTSNLLSVTYGNGLYVAVGSSGEVQISNNGMSWRRVGFTVDDSFQKVIWNGKAFVAVGRNTVGVSNDGVKWTIKKFDPQYKFECITWTGRNLIAVADNTHYDSKLQEYAQNTVVYCSTDCLNWTKMKDISGWVLRDMVWCNGQLYAVGYFNGVGIIVSTKDFIKWKVLDKVTGDNGIMVLYKIVYGNNGFVVYGSNDYIISSVDGVNWTDKTPKLKMKSYLNSIIWDGKQYVGVGSSKEDEIIEDSTGTIQTSPDGIKWTIRGKYMNTGALSGIVFDKINKKYIVTGDKGAIICSFDAIKWSITKEPEISYDFNDVKWNGKIFVVIGSQGSIYSSQDGKVWTKRESKTGKNLDTISWNGKEFLVGADDGVVLKSKDGVNWSAFQSNIIGSFSVIAYNGKVYTAVSYTDSDECLNKYLYYSKDGIKWNNTNLEMNEVSGYSNMFWNGKEFVLTYLTYNSDDDITNRYIAFSSDGVLWRHEETPANFPDLIEYNGRTYFGIVQEETQEMHAYLSDDLAKWEEVNSTLITSVLNSNETPEEPICFIKWIGNKFIAGGRKLIYSLDGKQWLEWEPVSSEYMTSADSNGNNIVIVGTGSTIITNFNPQNNKQ